MTSTRAQLAAGALLADGAAFALAVSHVGIGGELNPTAVHLYGAAGISGILAAKVIQAAIAALLVHRLRARRVSLLPAVVGLTGAATALVAFLP